jgi:membrane protein
MLQTVRALLSQAWDEWWRDNSARMGAALAYYTLFSVAPLLIVCIGICGFFFGAEAAQGRIVGELRGLVGEAGALAIEAVIESSRKAGTGILASVIAVVTLLLGASGVFGELKAALNVVWDVPVPEAKNGFLALGRNLLRERVLSFAMVLAIGFVLLVSLVVSAGLAAADGALHRYVTGAWTLPLHIVNTTLSLAVITAVFALMFKYLPDVRIAWRDVWVGALLTSVLFTIGKALLSLYLGHTSFTSIYGAAGSLVVLMIWVYYAAQIFFFGAELTQAVAQRRAAQHRQGSTS